MKENAGPNLPPYFSAQKEKMWFMPVMLDYAEAPFPFTAN